MYSDAFEIKKRDGGTAKLFFGGRPSLREIAVCLRSAGMGCNCDLDNWEPEAATGHSQGCRIHTKAQEIKGSLKDV